MNPIPLHTISEEKLVAACQRGEAQAQRVVYERFAPRMLALCQRYLPDAMEAEDAMIEGFVRVFGHINTFRGEGSFEGWIRRIMVNEALAQLRRHKAFAVYPLEGTKEILPLAAEQSLEEADLLRLIQRLPEGYRAVFNLYAIEGYSHKEIAVLLGISEGTSKSQLSRARLWLQQAIVSNEVN